MKRTSEGSDERAILILQHLIEEVADRSSKIMIMQSLGDFLYKIGRYGDAKAIYTEIIELDDKIADVWKNLGDLYDEYRDHDRAIECLLKSLELKEESETYSLLGTIYFNTGQFDLSMKSYLSSVQLNEKNHFAWYKLARLYGKEKLTEKCLQALLNAIDHSIFENYQMMALKDKEFNYLKDNPDFIIITTTYKASQMRSR